MRCIASTRSLLLPVLVLAVIGASHAGMAQSAYESKMLEWRRNYESELKAEGGWLSVAGLFWLKQGSNSFGSGRGNDILLPAGSPEKAGTFELRDGKVTMTAENGVRITSNGQPVTRLEMKTDSEGTPDTIGIGSLSLYIIKRGDRYGVRLKDSNSRQRREFKGLNWFPANEAWRVTARFIPYDSPRQITITNVLGDVLHMESPGQLVFSLNGQQYTLDPVIEEKDKLFIMFRDQTSGRSTYGAGRFLYAELPHNQEVTLDFNEATNPPCAYTPYATCPLPPKQNWLKVAVEAGEKTYHVEQGGSQH